jgi:hypothetical protein
MIENLKTDLLLRVIAGSRYDTLSPMDHCNPTSNNLQRIKNALPCSDFRLSSVNYVFKFSNEFFKNTVQRNWHGVDFGG